MFCTIEDIFVVVVQRVFPVGTGPLSAFSLRGSFSLINTPLKTTGIDGVNSRTQAGFPAPKTAWSGPTRGKSYDIVLLWVMSFFVIPVTFGQKGDYEEFQVFFFQNLSEKLKKSDRGEKT